jgi:redox-sensitive bicupin YhaK (pirin superfamily)
MSGPLEEVNEVSPGLGISAIEVREGRTASVGRFGVLRVLPTKRRRTVGPWCFVDLMRPGDVVEPPPIEIGPHPHIGLATATWMFHGTVLHSDSLGTEELIRPGELNLMTAGRGIAHAELGIEAAVGMGDAGIVGAQMWLALPDATRQGPSRFEHYSELPTVELGSGEARVIAGAFDSARSPARVDHPALGLDVKFRGAVEIPLDPTFEHGVVPVERPVKVEDAIVEPGSLALVPAGFERLRIEERAGSARFLLIGGEPFGVEIKMWWNFVARTFEEITEAWRAWAARDDDRFAPVPSRLARVEAPTPPWVRGVP